MCIVAVNVPTVSMYGGCSLNLTSLHTDVRNVDNHTPLHYACDRGHKETAQYLIQEGKCDVGMFIIVRNYVHVAIH